MSTRVQKGSAVFRPISKPRQRPSSASVPPTPVPEVIAPPAEVSLHDTSVSTTSVALPSITPLPYFVPTRHDSRGESSVPSATISSTPFESAMSAGHQDDSKSRRTRKPRAPSVMHTSVQEIDPTVTTMAALCNDIGSGRVSSKAAEIQSNHAAWRAANREKRARMRILMESKKYGRDQAEDGRDPRTVTPGTDSGPVAGPSNAAATSGTIVDLGRLHNALNQDGFDYSQDLATSRYNVQVRIGPNGETVIDEESLFVDRNEEENTENYTHVEESDTTKFVNSGTYGKKFRGSRWSAEETERFYTALAQFGENYELISYVLPGRDRKSCKNKFKAEDRKNPSRITHCLNNRMPYDIQTLARMTGKDFSGPVPEIQARAPLSLAEPTNLNVPDPTMPPHDDDEETIEAT